MKVGDRVRVIATQEIGVITHMNKPRDRCEPVRVDVDFDQRDLFDYKEAGKRCDSAPLYQYAAEKLEVI